MYNAGVPHMGPTTFENFSICPGHRFQRFRILRNVTISTCCYPGHTGKQTTKRGRSISFAVAAEVLERRKSQNWWQNVFWMYPIRKHRADRKGKAGLANAAGWLSIAGFVFPRVARPVIYFGNGSFCCGTRLEPAAF